MGDTVKRKKRLFLMAELGVLVCVFCIWLTTLVTADFNGAEAAAIKGIAEGDPHDTRRVDFRRGDHFFC